MGLTFQPKINEKSKKLAANSRERSLSQQRELQVRVGQMKRINTERSMERIGLSDDKFINRPEITKAAEAEKVTGPAQFAEIRDKYAEKVKPSSVVRNNGYNHPHPLMQAMVSKVPRGQ